jgi:hypothetical protein
MRKILSSNREVAHYFANNVQSEGSASNFFFEDDKLYSYGKHFCVARRLPSGLFAFTTRTYGNSTAKHLNYARSALSHKSLVWCNDPCDSARQNKAAAQSEIETQLANAERPRIRQTTRDSCKAAALNLAEKFNLYLAALPDDERGNVAPFDVSGLDEMRAAMVAQEQAKAAREEIRKAAAQVAAREYLADWRKDLSMRTQGMNSLPPALRLAYRERYADKAGHHTIETSHGAEIPADDARALWPLIVSVKRGERTSEEAARIMRRLGVYTLNQIRADGSIVVGCHDIAYSEIALMAAALGLADEVAA